MQGFCFGTKSIHSGLSGFHSNQGRTIMKLTTIVLAAVFALSSTFAFAYTSHHKKHSSQHRASYGQYYGNPNNRAGLVGGSDAGTGGGQYYGSQNNRGGWGGGWGGGWNTGTTGGNSQYYGNPNNRGGLVGGSNAGTYRP
jgi:preprotein translocase subunit SecG